MVLRVALGAVFIVHGWDKFGDVSSVAGFLGSLSVPAAGVLAWVVTLVELLGGVALVLGVFTHWAAKLLAINMIFALALVHFKNGFLVSAGGYEFVLVLFAAALSLSITGAGKHSLDANWKK